MPSVEAWLNELYKIHNLVVGVNGKHTALAGSFTISQMDLIENMHCICGMHITASNGLSF